MKRKRHKLGQYYTPNILTDLYIDNLKEIANKGQTVVDPFVGKGHLLFDYLDIFDFECARNLILNKKVKGYDIDEQIIINLKNKIEKKYNINQKTLDDVFVKNDSLINNRTCDSDFILTNPPYLSRSICSKKYRAEYNKYFKKNKFKDYYDISLNLYAKNDGLWIVPANFISSDSLAATRSFLISKKIISDINVFEQPIFKNTNISVVSFLISNIKNTLIQKNFDIKFIKKESETNKIIEINNNGMICEEWKEMVESKSKKNKQGLLRKNVISGNIRCILLNEVGELEVFYVSKDFYNHLKSNYLYLRTTDTGTEKGTLGLYTFEELYPQFDVKNKPISVLTKETSRMTVPIFFNDYKTKDEQILLMNEFNNVVLHYRKKYNSIFLTNFKNTTNIMARKRISFKDVSGLISNILIA